MLIKFSSPNFQNLFEKLALKFTEYTVYSVVLKNLAQKHNYFTRNRSQ